MVQVSYPGVYVQEVSSGVRTITGVATSVAAFVDSFARGLVDEAVQCLSYADFENEFGGLDNNSEASYAIKQFFQNGGGEAWVVRVATSGDAVATNNALASTLNIDDTAGAGGAVMFRVRAGRRLRGETALNPGAWGDNLRIEIDYDTATPESTFNLSVIETRLVNGQRQTLRTETFRNLTMDPAASNYAIEAVNEGSRLVQLDRDGLAALAAPYPRPAATGTIGSAIGAIPGGALTLAVTASGGTPARNMTVTGLADPVAFRARLEAAIRAEATDATNAATMTPAEFTMLSGATVKLIGRGTAASPYRYLVIAGRGADTPAEATLTFTGGHADEVGLNVIANVQQYVLGLGRNGTTPVSANALIGNESAKTGLYALEDADLFNILCIPRAADLSGNDMRAVYAQADAYCQKRRAFLLIDIPEGTDTLDEMQTWLTQNAGLRSRNAAVYFPRAFTPDPLNGNRLRSLGCSGTVAGLFARTDATRGVWKAPAGIEAKLQNVQGLAYNLTDAQNGALNPLAVNCLRTLPVYGHICWGARTLDGADALASEWKYIPIRRLALFIEESLYRGTQWVVFEPNDEPLWAKIRLNVGVFMNGLFRQGAFQGSTKDQAYFVKCDAETTTQADRNLGIVNIQVGFAPLKPAEFVVISIQQIAGDLQ